MSDSLGPDARSLVLSARKRRPSDEDRERSRRAILKRVAAGAAVVAATGSASSAAASNGAVAGSASAFAGVAGAIKLGAALGVLVVAGAAGISALQSPSETAPVSVASPARTSAPASTPPVPARVEAAQPGKPAEERPPVPSARPSASVATDRATPNASALAAEVEALRAARRALDDGNPEEAARILEKGDATIGSGVLSSERNAALLIARCRGATSTPGLEGELARFLRENPSSPLAPRVRAECARVTAPRDGGSP